MFLELQSNHEFKKTYFEMLKYRLAYGSLELEGIKDDLSNLRQSLQIFNQLQAINHIFDKHKKENMTHLEFTNILCEIAKKVSGDEISNFRTTEAIVAGSKIPRSKPQLIRNDLWYLIDDYNYQLSNCKTDRDIFETEAWFHIRLLHIHPFEDGNGRTSRILLTYNLCKSNLAPCIITKENKKLYCDLIEKGDYKGLADLFEELSNQELEVMLSLYRKLNEAGLIEENLMTKEQEEAYKLLKKNNK